MPNVFKLPAYRELTLSSPGNGAKCAFPFGLSPRSGASGAFPFGFSNSLGTEILLTFHYTIIEQLIHK